jgi:hypothetical protein
MESVRAAVAPLSRSRDLAYTTIGTLTLIVVVLHSAHDPLMLVLAVAALCAGLLRPGVLARPWWWLGLAGLIGVQQLSAWEGIDDHLVLLTYWLIALGLSLLATEPLQALALSGRMLVGLAFVFATAWKVLSGDFISTELFQFTLLVDDRFRLLATTFGGLAGSAYSENVEAVRQALTTESGAVELVTAGSIVRVAAAMTWLAIAIEAAVAGMFLLPLSPRWRWLRAAALALFCATTYLVVPITGFAAVLITMTLADPTLPQGWRRVLLWVFGALVVYTPLWHLLTG